MSKTIEQRVIALAALHTGHREEEIKTTDRIVEDLGADSLDTIELVMAIEEDFDFEIPDEDAERITSIQQAIDYVRAHAPKVTS